MSYVHILFTKYVTKKKFKFFLDLPIKILQFATDYYKVAKILACKKKRSTKAHFKSRLKWKLNGMERISNNFY